MPNRPSNSPFKTVPIINTIQKITVYETYHSFYIVGSNVSGNLFRVIKIDRLGDPKTLAFSEDQHDYDQYEIKDLLSMISVQKVTTSSSANQSSSSSSQQQQQQQTQPTPGIIRIHNAHAIIGFIKFLEGYYMILMTKKMPVAVLGYHVIYTIEDVNMIYIPYVDKIGKEINMDEQKYLKMFQTIDLRQNFYFSYSYDLTNTLQYNLTEVRQNENTNESAACKLIACKVKPSYKYVWNEFLLRPVSKKISHPWIVHLTHGYLSQSSLNIFGCTVYVTLVARRSAKYAGTRFLKRGGSHEGYVANEVETEQIVHSGHISSFDKGYFTSFVHCRGSIPLFWSQDPKQVPKPPIVVDLVDPFATLAARHFKQLYTRLGAPIIVLNLVKMREKKAQESILAEEYKHSLDYLRQFIPDESYLQYICFDMAKLNKTDKGNVMNILYDAAESCVKKTWFFQNFVSGLNENQSNIFKAKNKSYVCQTGAVRVNCVDCLDRTNTAMYVIGKCALAHQLYVLGILPTARLGPESACERMLIDLYEKCGDAIAQQYAGSQLVHRVDTYGKNSGIASQSRDMIHTLSRYYSNAFSDADKQNAMNIFLGIFEPSMYDYHIWDLTSDCYLHDPFIMQPWRLPRKYIEWIDSKLFNCLPIPYDQKYKSFENFSHIEQLKSAWDMKINAFDNFYRPNELIAFQELFYFNSLSTSRITNNSPSLGLSGNLRALLTRKRNSTNAITNVPNAVGSSLSSTSIQNDEFSDDDESTDDSFTIVPVLNVYKGPSSGSKDKTKPVKTNTKDMSEKMSILGSYTSFDLDEKSHSVYKKYADDSARLFTQSPNNNNTSDLSTSYSIISSMSSNSSWTGTPRRQLFQTPQATGFYDEKALYETYKSLMNNVDSLNYSSSRFLTDKCLLKYKQSLDFELNKAPSEASVQIYEDYVKKQQQQGLILIE